MRILKRVIVIVPPFTRTFLKSPSSRGLSAIAAILVLLYVDDVVKLSSLGVLCKLYADDVKLYSVFT